MKLLLSIKNNKYWYLYFLFIAFVFLKLYRGVHGVESSGGGPWNVIQVLFILYGFSFFFSKYNKRNSVVNILFFFSTWVLLVSFPSMISSSRTYVEWFYYFAILCAPSILVIFYSIGQRYNITSFSVWIKGSYYALIFLFYYYMTNYRANIGEGFFGYADIYYPLSLLPLVLLMTSPKRSYIPILFALVGVIVSGKRGGLVSLAIISFVYYIIGQKRNVLRTLLLLSVFVGLIVLSSSIIDSLDSLYGTRTIQRMEEINEDGGSGRFDRWGQALIILSRSSATELMFGHGFNSVYDLLDGRAHNDFIEVIINFGLISMLLYVLFYIYLITQNIRQYHFHYSYSKYITCSISNCLVLSMVSCFVVEPTYILVNMFVIGLILGDYDKYNKIVRT